MSLSECQHCGGHIPLGPNASNRCGKCGHPVMGIPAATAVTDDQIARARTVHIPSLNPSGYLHAEDAKRVLEAALGAAGDGIALRVGNRELTIHKTADGLRVY